jgi:hypothetical protein
VYNTNKLKDGKCVLKNLVTQTLGVLIGIRKNTIENRNQKGLKDESRN